MFARRSTARYSEHGSVFGPGVLTASVGVMHQSLARPTSANGRSQHLEHESLLHVFAQMPGDDPSRMAIWGAEGFTDRSEAYAGFLKGTGNDTEQEAFVCETCAA